MTKNNIFVTIFSVLIIFGFLFIVYSASNKPSTDTLVYAQLQKPTPLDYVKWGKNKKHVLVEFTDFQCPACRSFHDILKQYESSKSAEYKIAQQITFVHKNFPLEQTHKNARIAAYAAESAGKQGKFFEFGSMLFENQTTWAEDKNPQDYFYDYAKELKLNEDKFKSDMKSSEIKKRVDNDIVLGNQVKVNSTPSFYIDGKKMEFANLDEFKKQLSESIK